MSQRMRVASLLFLLSVGWREMFVSCGVSVSSSSSSSWTLSSQSLAALMWEHKAALDNKISSPSPHVFHRYLTAPTRGRCALECQQRTWCASFFYRHDGAEGTCLLDSTVLQSEVDVGPGRGFRYYVAASDQCDHKKGFIFYPGERLCFRVFPEMVTDWDTANARCQAEGLQLVVPESRLQMWLLQTTVNRTQAFRKKNNYLGIVRPRDQWDLPWREGVPVFVDANNRSVSQDLLDEKLWVHNNPNNQKDKQNCVQIDKKRDNLLNDLGCFYNNYFICQKVWQ